MARRGYVSGTAAALGVTVPRQESAGGLLMLLVGAYLLLAFVTGRLGWLTDTLADVFAAKARYSAPATTPATPAPTQAAPTYVPAQPRPRTWQPAYG